MQDPRPCGSLTSTPRLIIGAFVSLAVIGLVWFAWAASWLLEQLW